MLTTCEQHSRDTQTQTHTADISTQTYKPSTQEDTVTRDDNSLQEEFTAEYVIKEQEKSYQCIKILAKEGIPGQFEASTQTEIPSINEKATKMDSPLCICKLLEKIFVNKTRKTVSQLLRDNESSSYTQTDCILADSYTQTDRHTHLEVRTQTCMADMAHIAIQTDLAVINCDVRQLFASLGNF